MTAHRAHPVTENLDRWGLSQPDPPDADLYDDCPRCLEHAQNLTSMDRTKFTRLWRKMVDANRSGGDRVYATRTEMLAGSQMYRVAVLLERHFGVDPWSPSRAPISELRIENYL